MTTAEPHDAVELLLGVDGALGEMDFPSVVQALQRAYELLDRTAHRVLGDRADSLRWHLTGLREGSALTVLEAAPTDQVSLEELQALVGTFELDMQDPTGRLPDEDLPVLRELLSGLAETDSGSLFTQRSIGGTRTVVAPAIVLPLLGRPLGAPLLKVIGSVAGTLESLTVHDKREASLYNDYDHRRVVVSFAEGDYARVHAALRKRVEIFGVLVEDTAGRPVRIRMQDLEVLPTDDELPTLRSLFGSMPQLTEGLSADDFLKRNRRELGLG